MYTRHVIQPIIEALSDTPVILVNGARQTGKSTLCDQIIKSGIFKGQFVTMDDPATLLAAEEDPLGFLVDLGPHVIIDEAQRVPSSVIGPISFV